MVRGVRSNGQTSNCTANAKNSYSFSAKMLKKCCNANEDIDMTLYQKQVPKRIVEIVFCTDESLSLFPFVNKSGITITDG